MNLTFCKTSSLPSEDEEDPEAFEASEDILVSCLVNIEDRFRADVGLDVLGTVPGGRCRGRLRCTGTSGSDFLLFSSDKVVSMEEDLDEILFINCRVGFCEAAVDEPAVSFDIAGDSAIEAHKFFDYAYLY